MTTGQIGGAVVGAVAGYFTGGVGWSATASAMMSGASVGMAIGSALDPPPGPKIVGPRISDLSQQAASYGVFIPRVYGSAAIMGNVFWIENNSLKEHSHTEEGGGKGGGGGGSETTTYSYTATFALGLCEGPIAGIRRIWISDKLFYDGGASDIGTFSASAQAAAGFRVHLGDESQAPDSRMQATLGVANTPAYRGLSYIVFDDLDLAKYGNTLAGAQISVEVVSLGATNTYVSISDNAGPAGYQTGIIWDGGQFVAVDNNYSYTSPDGISWTSFALPGACYDSARIAYHDGTYVVTGNQNYFYISDNGKTWKSILAPATNNWVDIEWCGSCFIALGKGGACARSASDDGRAWISFSIPGTEYAYTNIEHINGCSMIFNWYTNYSNNTVLAQYYRSVDNAIWTFHGISGMNHGGVTWGTNDGMLVGSVSINFHTGHPALISTTDGINWTIRDSVNIQGQILWDGDSWVIWGTQISYSPDLASWGSKANPCSPYAVAFNGQDFVGISATASVVRKRVFVETLPTVSYIVEAECKKSVLLSSSDVEVTTLTDNVRGYRIGSVAAIRSGLEPLQAAWPFDIVQSGYKLKFKRRGGSSIATIAPTELGAGAEGEAVARFTEVREMSNQLPARISLSFMDVSREYDVSEQYAERLNVDSVHVRSMELAMSLTVDEAAQKAEILLYMYWMERYDLSFKLPPSYGYLEPSDVITVQAESGTYEVRLTSINYQSDGILDCTAKLSRAASYTSAAVGEASPPSTGTLSLPVDSKFELVDAPLMVDDLDLAGFIVAMSGARTTWDGGTVFKSTDGGQTWSVTSGFSTPSVFGITGTKLSTPTEFRLIDKRGSLEFFPYGGGLLSSVTELQMLNGFNHFAYGINGRWEIIAAQNCTLTADGRYILTDFLRGRYGTEWAMGLHADADKLVLLDTNHAQFALTSTNLIGQSADYRGVTVDQSISSGVSVPFTYTGVNLECLSPVYLSGSKNPSTNDWSLSWLRRTRKGGEWRDYIDAAVGEATEKYDVEIYSSNAYTTLKRTLAGLTTPAATYTSADQVTDFGYPQPALYLKVYQVSSTVGRGYPLASTLVMPFNANEDPYPSYTTLLLRCNGTNGASVFTDATGKTVTVTGATTLTTSAKFGSTGGYFNGTSNYLSIANNVGFNFGSGDLTLECWMKPTSISDGLAHMVFYYGPNQSVWVYQADQTVIFAWGTTGADSLYIQTGNVLVNTSHSHVACVRSGTSMKIYVNGIEGAAGTLIGPVYTTAGTLQIGTSNGVNFYKGSLDDIRITKGVARYQTNFTPPTVELP